MGLSNALSIGRSGLLANQTAIEVTGNNLANVATKGYSRQTIQLAPVSGQAIQRGIIVGRGVKVQGIVRHVDNALEARLQNGISNEAFSLARQEVLSGIEALQNELSDADLSSQLNEFFNAFSELVNGANNQAMRTTVIQQSQSLSNFIQGMRDDLSASQTELDGSLDVAVTDANRLLDQISQVNQQIVRAGGGGGNAAHALRDQRDTLVNELAGLLEISINETSAGATDVFLGSLPIILNNQSRGLEIRRETIDGQLQVNLIISDDGSVLNPTSGRLGALLQGRKGDYQDAIGAVDKIAEQLIFQVNKIHTEGQGLRGFDSVTSSQQVTDPDLVLDDPKTGLGFVPGHGSFQVHIGSTSSIGQRISKTIDIDLDEVDPDNNTTLQSLADDLNAIADLNASVTSDGRLSISTTADDLEISFSNDTSDVLAVLGINTFFTGSNAADIGVNQVVLDDPSFIAAAADHSPGDNHTALLIAGLRDRKVEELNGASLSEFWAQHVQDIAIRVGQAGQQVEADAVVRSSLENQRHAVSGVNTDEEAINLLTFQRAYQGSARFISVVDELLQTLLTLI